MTLDQAMAFAVILGTIALLIWDRVRYDLVALLALLASVACGIVPAAQAFRGFSSDIVIIIGSALVVSAAIGRSGLVETLMKPFVPKLRKLEILPGCGHWVQQERPAEVNAEIIAFLKSL